MLGTVVSNGIFGVLPSFVIAQFKVFPYSGVGNLLTGEVSKNVLTKCTLQFAFIDILLPTFTKIHIQIEKI